ncbi:hypothetical protein B0H16DRAFT_1716977 [Mycena metata]|uniref:BHLH domain-containing protein n=1 Tax=Mycena metata TaxID=1033252 RepID=A0AAD7NMM5_9AGAR|nr:hypothetical protein B0H16DRAFT_1716977 [Mycena metata]
MDKMSQFTSMDLGMGIGIDMTDFSFPVPLPSSGSENGGSTGSFSPPPSMCAASVNTGYSAPSDNPAAELANCIHKNAGLVLAMQIGSELQYQPHQPSVFTTLALLSYPTTNTPASMFTTAPVAPSAPPMLATPSLRQAIPVLHVVNRAAAIKTGEPYPSGDASDPEDHINVRGFVDSVKIVHKCSKANVLSKAVEYICVLKNREKRLTRELKGLKTLLRGLLNNEGGGGVTVCGMGLLQVFHLLASVAVLVSVVWPVGRAVWAQYIVSVSRPQLEKPAVAVGEKEEEEGSKTV